MAGPRLLSGGNPQIPKGYGEEPISAYLDAVPGWKQAVCRRIDTIVSEAVPDVRKAIKWNSPPGESKAIGCGSSFPSIAISGEATPPNSMG